MSSLPTLEQCKGKDRTSLYGSPRRGTRGLCVATDWRLGFVSGDRIGGYWRSARLPIGMRAQSISSRGENHVDRVGLLRWLIYARASGRPVAFAMAASSTALWLLAGPVFGFSDTWQLITNTSTSVITFLMAKPSPTH